MAVVQGEVRRVSEDLTLKIVSGHFAPGLRLPPESTLATTYGCGRSTVREALRHLADLGVVQSRQGSGAVVLDYRRDGRSMGLLVPWLLHGQHELDLDLIAQVLLQARTYLACEGARLASLYAEPEDLKAAQALIDKSVSLESDPLAHSKNDFYFHFELCVASRVWPAVWMSNTLQAPLLELIERLGFAIVPKNYLATMKKLLDAVSKREAVQAVEILKSHLETVDQEVIGLISRSRSMLESPS